MSLTIGIKALNEERHIAASIQSALQAAAPFGGEVILADSGSTDRTLDIARQFPIRIVQFADPRERSCGAGAQLAYQHATGDYFYLLDGDMVLDPGFMADGLAYLDTHPDVAGVGGLVCEVNTVAHEFQIRADTRSDAHWQPGPVDRLDCGGLYRTSAIRACGYFADRNLHAFEEFELAARLHSRGWRLARIDRKAVDHFGHVAGGYSLLWRRLRSGYAGAAGEVLRAALGRRHLPIVLRRLSHLRHALVVIAWWLFLVVCTLVPAWRPALVPLLAAPLLLLWWRRRSLRLGLFSFASWNAGALGFVRSLFTRRIAPGTAIRSIDLSQPGGAPRAGGLHDGDTGARPLITANGHI